VNLKKLKKKLKTLLLQRKVNNRSVPLIVMGLGNPGPEYAGTRHNAGYMVIDALAEKPPLAFRKRFFSSYYYAYLSVPEYCREIVLVRYTGYMNTSGEITASLFRRFNASPEDLLVVVDNMDLPPGVCRLKKDGGSAGHNGIKSIINRTGTSGFYRLYIGVGRPDKSVDTVSHVLGRPDEQDEIAIKSACNKAAGAVKKLSCTPFSRVMEELNKRERH
jgi:PTH1 family peptidyl-tRNA hydrolase